MKTVRAYKVEYFGGPLNGATHHSKNHFVLMGCPA